jgi:phage shock protein C
MKKLHRSPKDRKISGLYGGLAEYFDVDPIRVRILAVAAVFLTGIGLSAYRVMSVVIPNGNGGN